MHIQAECTCVWTPIKQTASYTARTLIKQVYLHICTSTTFPPAVSPRAWDESNHDTVNIQYICTNKHVQVYWVHIPNLLTSLSFCSINSVTNRLAFCEKWSVHLHLQLYVRTPSPHNSRQGQSFWVASPVCLNKDHLESFASYSQHAPVQHTWTFTVLSVLWD